VAIANALQLEAAQAEGRRKWPNLGLVCCV